MMLKELDPFAPGDPLARAGRAAEEQVDASRTLQTGTGLIAQALRLAFGGDVAKELCKEEVAGIADFLLRHHSPKATPSDQGARAPQRVRRSQPTAVPGVASAQAGVCRYCGSRAMQVEYMAYS